MEVLRLRLLVTVVLLIFIFVGSGWGAVGKKKESSIPVHFLQNKEISIDLYPAGFQSAAVLTGTVIDGEEDLYPLQRLVFLLANQGVRATIFISPGEIFRKNIAENQQWESLLSKIAPLGFEIAQNTLSLPEKSGSEKGIEDGSGPRPLQLSQWIDEIRESHEFLTSLGLEPAGYRGYDPPAAEQIIPFLGKMGYLYFFGGDSRSDSGQSGRTNPAPEPEDTYLYPEHTPGLPLLKFRGHLDPTVDLKKARRLYREVSRKSGIFICHIYLPGLIEKPKLDKLRQFITDLKKQNSWICSLRELSEWWNAREKVEIKTGWDENTLVIVYDNPTRFLLKNARLNFKGQKIPVRYYRVENRQGIMASRGIIPASRFVNVTLFPTENSS